MTERAGRELTSEELLQAMADVRRYPAMIRERAATEERRHCRQVIHDVLGSGTIPGGNAIEERIAYLIESTSSDLRAAGHAEIARVENEIHHRVGDRGPELAYPIASFAPFPGSVRFGPDFDQRYSGPVREVFDELAAAQAKFPRFNGPHEGWAVIREELDELWDLVRENDGDTQLARVEAVQIAAMAIRYMMEVTR